MALKISIADGVGAHPHRSADSLVAGPALVGVSVLAADQIRVDGQCAGRQTQQKYIVGQLKVVLDWIALGPWFVLHSVPPWVCCGTHSANFALDSTNLLLILRTGSEGVMG